MLPPMTQPAPEDYSDDELLEMLNPVQLAELDRQIGEMFGAEGVDRIEAISAAFAVWSAQLADRIGKTLPFSYISGFFWARVK